MPLRVLTWNLKHGRAVPSAGRDLFDEFAAALAGWDWDLALLQEVPPWWPERLGGRLDAAWRLVLTSRNLGLAARRAGAVRWPDVIKSSGGGSNAVLVRSGSLVEDRSLRLTLLPERRWLLGVQVQQNGIGAIWAGVVHLTGSRSGSAARAEARAAADAMLGWANGLPVVLGGDFNLGSVTLPGFARAGGNRVDHVFVHGFDVPIARASQVLDSRPLSDHAPLVVTVRARD